MMRIRKLSALMWVLCLAVSIILSGCGITKQGAISKIGSGGKGFSEKKITISYATVLPADHIFVKSAERMNKKMLERSGGRLGLQVFPGGQHGSEKDNVESVVLGTLDMAFTSPGELGKRHDKLLMLDAPYVFRNPEHAMKVLNGGAGAKLFEELRQKSGLVDVGNMFLGTRQLTTVKVPVRTPGDLKGLKIRVPDTPISVAYCQAMGAKPTPMAITEVYLALQQGVVDGAENPISQILSNRFNEVQKYISLTSHVVQTNQLVFNERKFNSLPDDLRKIMLEVIKEESDICVQEMLDYEKNIIERLPSYKFEVIRPNIDVFRKTAVENFKSNSIWNEEVNRIIQSTK